MKKYTTLFFATLLVFFSCNNPDKVNTENTNPETVQEKPVIPALVFASMDAVAPDSVRKDFQNLSTFANCTSPLGKYTTQVNTTVDGYMYFKQTFSYNPVPFEAVLYKDSAWYQMNDTTDVIPKSLLFNIRVYALHNILLELPQKFHGFGKTDTVELKGERLIAMEGKDILDHSCTFYFDTQDNKLAAWKFLNPDKWNDTILVKFTDWKKAGLYNLPYLIEMEERGKQFSFNYTKIEVNNPKFKKTVLKGKKKITR